MTKPSVAKPCKKCGGYIAQIAALEARFAESDKLYLTQLAKQREDHQRTLQNITSLLGQLGHYPHERVY